MDLSLVPYCHIEMGGGGAAGEPAGSRQGKVRYRECLRNHAAAMGGLANDGCGEFMPGDGGLTCAACGCHRNFHRKEAPTGGFDVPCQLPAHPPLMVYPAAGKSAGMVGFPPHSQQYFSHYHQPHHHHQHHQQQQQVFHPVELRRAEAEENRRSETPEEQREGGQPVRKRFRTKFTPEQKEKMQAFAEKLGWRMQRQDDVELQQFCMEVGIQRRVLKVWMHNNKNTLGKKLDQAPNI